MRVIPGGAVWVALGANSPKKLVDANVASIKHGRWRSGVIAVDQLRNDVHVPIHYRAGRRVGRRRARRNKFAPSRHGAVGEVNLLGLWRDAVGVGHDVGKRVEVLLQSEYHTFIVKVVVTTTPGVNLCDPVTGLGPRGAEHGRRERREK